MRVLMTFVTIEAEQKDPQRVITGPAWESNHTAEVFELMRLEVDLGHGLIPLARFAEGLARARQTLEDEPWKPRPKISKTIDSLATWATVARMKGATAIAWQEDF